MKSSGLFLMTVMALLALPSLLSAQASQLWGVTTNGGNGGGVVFHVNGDGELYQKVHSFIDNRGSQPLSVRMVEHADGWLYGTAYRGGGSGFGVIYRFDTATGTYEVIHDFEGIASGERPNGTLLLGSDGKFYGLAESGGAYSAGALYSIDPVNLEYTLLHSFTGYADGLTPSGILVQDANGLLYGSTQNGGTGPGVIFSFDPESGTYSTLHSFDVSSGAQPYGGHVLLGESLIGMTATDINGYGVIYSYDLDTGFSVLRAFTGSTGSTQGAQGFGDLIADGNGNIYGLTYSGGIYDQGVLFQYAPSSDAYTVLHDFSNATGDRPAGSLWMEGNKLYGLTETGGSYNAGVLFEFDLSAATGWQYAVLDEFDVTTAGANPQGSLVRHSNGKLYGAATAGGPNSWPGDGVIFSVDPATDNLVGEVNFNLLDNGYEPYGKLVQKSDGLLYGITRFGGEHGGGVLYSLDPANSTFTNHHDFSSNHGANPTNGLCLAGNDTLYGVTNTGGDYSYGTMFKWHPGMTSSVKVHSFANNMNDGGAPAGPLIEDQIGGKLYGTSPTGGMQGSGTIFEFNYGLNMYNVMVDLNGSTDGSMPMAGLCLASNGRMYGTTITGGPNGNGTIFEYFPGEDDVTVIHNFIPQPHGFNCNGELMQASDGYIYGMASQGGGNGFGTLFRFHPDTTGSFVKLADFDSAVNGDTPLSGLIEANNGKLYGMTYEGGSGDIGMVFEYDPLTGELTSKLELNGQTGFYPDADFLSINCTPSASSLNANSCGPYTAPSGAIFTDSGIYQDIILSATGCDSIITINLTVENLDLGVFVNDPTLSATVVADSWQWLDCNNAFAPIPGATSPDFTATVAGSYACQITSASCTDTTTCVPVFNVGIEDYTNPSPELLVFPNPANRELHVYWEHAIISGWELVDLQGRVVFSDSAQDQKGLTGRCVIPVDQLPAGMYLLRSKGGHAVARRILIE